MKIYVASSWRNEERQQATVKALREAGHEVYDFRNPAPGNEGFGWRFCAPDPAALKDPRRFRDEVLPHPSCKTGFDFDMNALRAADATVLVLPCGRSAHLELGYATGVGQKTVVLLDDPMSEPELMYMACDSLCVSITEVVSTLECFKQLKPPTVQAKATYIRGMWDLKIKCPYCSKEHSHGGGIGVEPEYGHRASHCSFSEEQAKDAGSFAGYILIPRAVTA